MTPKRSWIILENDPLLRQRSEEVNLPLNDLDKECVTKMIAYVDACYNDEDLDIHKGIAIAAPQVGLSKRIIYLHFDDYDGEKKFLLANPRIVKESVKKSCILSGEGCLSVESIHDGIVLRSYKVVVEAIDLLNDCKKITLEAESILSICLQHEIDHLDGILYFDKIKNTKFLQIPNDLVKY